MAFGKATESRKDRENMSRIIPLRLPGTSRKIQLPLSGNVRKNRKDAKAQETA